MKKLLIVGFMGLLALSVQAASWKFFPLFSGYNVLAGTNGTTLINVPDQLGQSNVLFTTYSGQALYSLNTNTFLYGVAGSYTSNSVNTNILAPDAFKVVDMNADANGDVVANAALVIIGGYTNWAPNLYLYTNTLTYQVSVWTNSSGNYWPLSADNGFPNWQYPATANTYPTYPVNTTNTVTISLYADIGNIRGADGSGVTLYPASAVSESTASFSCSFNEAAGVGWMVTTNLPTVFTQHAKKIWGSIQVTPVAGLTSSTNMPINQMGVLQLVP